MKKLLEIIDEAAKEHGLDWYKPQSAEPIKKSNPLDPLIQQAKANIAMVNKVAAQNPRSMLFGNKKGNQHGFVSVDPSKPNQWRITHFVKGEPSGHTEAASFSDAIKKAHSSGYDVSKELSEEDMYKTEDLEKGARGDWEKEGYKLEHYKDQHGTHNVSAYDKHNNLVGYANFKDHLVPDIHDVYLTSHPNYMVGWDVAVHPDHQRKGLASAMYELAEKKSGKKILRGGTTPEGSAFWKQPNKKFGNLTIDDKINIKPLAAKKSMDIESIKKSEDFSRVSSVIVATDDKMLMLQRRDNNKWTFPGGHLNDTETHLQGAVRELWEEAGIRANPDEMILLGNKKTFQNKDIYVYLYKVNSEIKPSADNDPDKEAKKFEWLPHVLPEEIKEKLYIPVGDNSSLSMFSVWLLRQKTNKLKELIESKKSV